MPTLNTWHSVPQTNGISSTDINQELSVHTLVSSYSDGTIPRFTTSTSGVTMGFGGPFANTSFSGWAQIDGITNFSIAQSLDGINVFSGSRLRIPISYLQLATNSNATMNNYSSSCDVTVSLQGSTSSGGHYYPDGVSSYSLTIPKEILNALPSSNWTDGNEYLPGPFYSMNSSMIPSASLTTTTFHSVTITSSTITSFTSNDGIISVVDIANFSTLGGNAILFDGSNSTTISYTSVDAVNNYLLGCQFVFGNTGVYPVGSFISLTTSTDAQFVNASTYVVVTNITSSNSTAAINAASTSNTGVVTTNDVYFAEYLTGEVGLWSKGAPLPEYKVAITFAPSCSVLYAIGPSGTLYSASFPQDGTMGTWQSLQLTYNNSGTIQGFSFPAFNLLSTDVTPSLSVVTIDSIDYLFIFGGVSNGQEIYNGYYAILDSSGVLSSLSPTPQLPCDTGQGRPFQRSSLCSFSVGNLVYVRDTTDMGFLTLYCMATWIDGNSVFQVGSWQNVIAQYYNPLFSDADVEGFVDEYQLILGVQGNNIITNTSVIGLSKDGACTSDNIMSLATFYGGVSAYDALTNAVVFLNDDGTLSLLSSYGFASFIYPSTWIDIPLPSNVTGKFLVLTESGGTRTNFGVNIALQDTRVYVPDSDESPSLTYTFPPYVVQTVNGWSSNTNNQMLSLVLFSATNSPFPNFMGFVEDNIARWSTVKYTNPCGAIQYIADVTYDPTGKNTTSSLTSHFYDGIAGLNNQPMMILTSTMELS